MKTTRCVHVNGVCIKLRRAVTLGSLHKESRNFTLEKLALSVLVSFRPVYLSYRTARARMESGRLLYCHL